MKGSGTIVNSIAVIAGGLIGLTLKGGLKQRFQDIIMQALGLSVIFIGIAGVLQDGLTGDASMLYIKAVLDGVVLIVFASVFGKGAVFSAIPLFLFQGSITLSASLVQPFLTEEAVSYLSFIGSALIFCVGTNLMFKTNIKVANLLPALIFAVLLHSLTI